MEGIASEIHEQIEAGGKLLGEIVVWAPVRGHALAQSLIELK